MAVDAERIKELEKIDKRFAMRKRLTAAFFVLLSVVLVLYAVSIERKIDRLTEAPAVVVYTDASEETSNIIEESGNSTDYSEDDVIIDESAFVEDEQTSDDTKVYYITASGKKYHNAGCSYLTKSKREITSAEILSGGYTSCSRCVKE